MYLCLGKTDNIIGFFIKKIIFNKHNEMNGGLVILCRQVLVWVIMTLMAAYK